MRKLFAAAAAAIVVSAVSFSTAMAQDKPTIGVVVKIGGIPWFNAMEAGIQSKAAELGVDAFMVGPTSADPALQVRAVEDLIARGVDVIGVVPNDAEVLEPVLARAREAGIIVLTHEAVGLQNKDFDFELITDKALGEANAKLFAKSTGCTGKYAIFVGGLTVPAHNAWAKAAIDYLSANCPEMTMVADRFGVANLLTTPAPPRWTFCGPIRTLKAFSALVAKARSVPLAPLKSAACREKSPWSASSPPDRASNSCMTG